MFLRLFFLFFVLVFSNGVFAQSVNGEYKKVSEGIYAKNFKFFDKFVNCSCRKEDDTVIITYLASKQQGKSLNRVHTVQQVVYKLGQGYTAAIANDSLESPVKIGGYYSTSNSFLGKSINQKAFKTCITNFDGLPKEFKKIIIKE